MHAVVRIGHAALFLGAALVAALGMRAATPAPTEQGLGAKLAFYREHAAEFDLVYVGSSHVFRSFAPSVIDPALAERGLEVRSFNAGVAGMGDFEADWMLDELLAAGSKRLRWIVLEVPRFDPTVFRANAASDRELNWHTLRETRAAVAAARLNPHVEARRALIEEHVELGVRRFLNIGQGRRLVAGLLFGDTDLDEHGLGSEVLARDGGYRALEDESGSEFARRRENFLADLAGYDARVAAIEMRRRMRPPLGAYPLDLLRGQVERARAAGVELVYVLPPGSSTKSIAFTLDEAGLLPHFLDLCSPARHPELFEHSARFDRNHLTRDAAVELSRIFADAFADVIREGAGG